MTYLIRIGQFGQIGRFSSEFDLRISYGQRVICRTAKGLEVGEALGPDTSDSSEVDGNILRLMTEADLLLEERLGRNRTSAIEKCQKLIDHRQLPVSILDAELTFDGRRLYFYFSGEPNEELDELTRQLAEEFDSEIRFSEFASLLAEGCGPGCGGESAGCSSTGCGSCSLQSGCGSKTGPSR